MSAEAELDLRSRKGLHNIELLGGGAQGKVYALHDGGQRFALKIYFDSLAQRRIRDVFDTISRATLREKREPPNSISNAMILDWGSVTITGSRYSAALCKFVQGPDLFSTDSFSPEPIPTQLKNANRQDRLVLARQLAEGVSYLHQHRIVHADLAPNNIKIVEHDCQLVILDVDGGGILGDGGSWQVEPLVRGHLGIAGFPSPQEVKGDTPLVSKELDYWWLAVDLFYVLTCASPFFFLTYLGDESLVELSELCDNDDVASWPPPHETIHDHPYYQKKITRMDLMRMRRFLNSFFPSRYFCQTFSNGYSDRSMRTSPNAFTRFLRNPQGRTPG